MAAEFSGASNAIGFFLQLDDQMSPALDSIERGYARATRALDKMNKTIQGRSNKTVTALNDMAESLEALPSRIISAAKELESAVKTITPGGKGGSSTRNIATSVQKAVEKALSNVRLQMSATLPSDNNGSLFHMKGYRKAWKKMPPPPDYSGGFTKFADGGLVRGGVKGKDSVPGLLMPGEVVLPVDTVNALRGVFGRGSSGPKFEDGGTVFGRRGLVMDALVPLVREEVRDMTYVQQSSMGGAVGQAMLEFAHETKWSLIPESMKKFAGGLRGWAKTSDAIGALKSAVTGVRDSVSNFVGGIKARLGVDQDSSLIKGAATVGVVGGLAAASTLDDDWTLLHETINSTSESFRDIQKTGYDAMVNLGIGTDTLFSIYEQGVTKQKRFGKDLEKFVDLTVRFSAGNEELRQSAGDLLYEMNRYGVSIDKAEGIMSALIDSSKKYDVTLEQLTAGTTSIGDALRVVKEQGGDAAAVMSGLAGAAGKLSGEWIDANTSYELFATLMDPDKINESYAALAMAARHMGQGTDQMKAQLGTATGFANFMEGLVKASKDIDITNIGAMEAFIASTGGLLDSKMVQDLRKIKPGSIVAAAEESLAAAAKATAMQARWAEHSAMLGEIWGRMKNSFYAVFIQLGELYLVVMKPIFQVLAKGLQMVAMAVNAIGWPLRYALSGLIAFVAFIGPALKILYLYKVFTKLSSGLNMMYTGFGGVNSVLATFIPGFKYISGATKEIGGSIWGFARGPLSYLRTSLGALVAPGGYLSTRFPETMLVLRKGVEKLRGTFTSFGKTITDFRTKGIRGMTADMWKNRHAIIKSNIASLAGISVKTGETLSYWALTKAIAKNTWTRLKNMAIAVKESAVSSASAIANFRVMGLAVGPIALVAAALGTVIYGLQSSDKWMNALGATLVVLSPILLIIGVKIAAIAGALILAGAAVMAVIDIFRTGGVGISDFMWRLGEVFGAMEEWSGTHMGEFGKAVSQVMSKVRLGFEWMSGLFSEISQHWGDFYSAMKPGMDSLGMAMQSAFGQVWETIKDVFGITDLAGDSVHDFGNQFAGVGAAMQSLGKDFGDFMGMMDPVIRAFGTLVSVAIYAGKALWTYVWKPQLEGMQLLFSAAKWIGDQLWSYVWKPQIDAVSFIYDLFSGKFQIGGMLLDFVSAAANVVSDIFGKIKMWFIQGIFSWVIEPLVGFLSSMAGMFEASKVPGTGYLAGGLRNLALEIVPDIPMMAKGGLVSHPTMAMIGEAGPEAVVPLDQGGAVIMDETNELLRLILRALLSGGRQEKGNVVGNALMRNYMT